MSTNADIDIAAGQLSQMSYVFGSATDTLYVRANDGTEWGAWQRFTASPHVNQAPVVTVANRAMISDDTAAISALITAADPDGDSISRYQLWDSTSVQNSGHWVVNGVAQAANAAIDVTAEQLAQTSFHAGTNISDQLWVRAFDGTDWGRGSLSRWSLHKSWPHWPARRPLWAARTPLQRMANPSMPRAFLRSALAAI